MSLMGQQSELGSPQFGKVETPFIERNRPYELKKNTLSMAQVINAGSGDIGKQRLHLRHLMVETNNMQKKEAQYIKNINQNLKQQKKFKKNPYFNKDKGKTNHGDYLDKKSLYKMGQIDEDELLIPEIDYNESFLH